MSYRAKVIKVTIVSPSDVSNERVVIRNVLQEWNYMHSEERNIMLMPVGWESHSAPAVGARPQAIINKQVLAGCDLLVAVFWTKLGTPTGKAVSGTVEEIEEHVKAKKPAMIYFSSIPVPLDSIDPAQHAALREFKEEMGKRGLYSEYASIDEFREKFSRQLAQTVIRYFTSKKNGNGQAVEDLTIPSPELPAISAPASRLLVEAAQDTRGVVLRFRSLHGLAIHTNGKDLAEGEEPRRRARWESALKELQRLDLLQDRGSRGEVFAVTDEGYRIADLLREHQYA